MARHAIYFTGAMLTRTGVAGKRKVQLALIENLEVVRGVEYRAVSMSLSSSY
jgi:hypothetical protein